MTAVPPSEAADGGRFVEAGGVRWHVQVMGRGPTVLLLHGTGASGHSFRSLAPLLAERFTVIVPDLPGHARSTKPSAFGMSVDGMARSMAALLVALDAQPEIAVGHSAGAAVLVRMALDRQLRLRALIGLNAALMPLGGLMRVLSPMAKLLSLAPGVPRLVGSIARDDRAVRRLVDSTGSKIDAEASRRYAELIRDPRHVAGAIAMMAAWNLDRTWAQMPRLQTAPLLIVGDNDRTVPPQQATRVAAHIVGTEIVMLAGLGHLAHEEAPETIAALIVTHAGARGVLAS
ncbi:MAG: alpha/beta fold hydrolase BchO [Burkholderiaceae bacterium]